MKSKSLKYLISSVRLAFAITALLAPHIASATIETDGALDQTFDAGNFTNGQVNAAILQPDGKLVIGGLFNKVHGVVRHNLARLNADGTLDLTFDPGDGPDYGINNGGILLGNDGKLLIFGGFAKVGGMPRSAGIARLNSNGSLDAAFDPGRGISNDGLDDGAGNATSPGSVTSAVLQSDGKLVVVGNFTSVITGPGMFSLRASVARFNSDGTFDPSYDPGAGLVNTSFYQGSIYAVRQNLGPNSGKVIIAGIFDSFDGHPVPGLVRLNTDGSYDSTFVPTGPGPEPFTVYGVWAQSDDRIIVFGTFTSFSNVACTGIVRLENSGEVDTNFNPPALDSYHAGFIVYAVAQQPDGKLIVGGSFHSLGGAVANNVVRLQTNGARDGSFDATAAGPSANNVSAIVVRPSDGKIFVGGYFSTYGSAPRNNIAWVESNGSVESTFAGLSGATDSHPEIYALATQPDGKILVGGLFSSFNGSSHYNLVRLNPDATIDPSFDPTFQTEGSVRAIVLQPDGKIVIAGNLRAVNGVARGSIARLNADGTLDTSFDPGTGADNRIYALMQDSAGNTYVGGIFNNFDGVSRMRLAKLTPTGALDLTFNPGTGPNSTVYAIAPGDAAGGIIIGGAFSSYKGSSVRAIARLNATTAARDFSFNSGGSGFLGQVRALKLGPDGKYYVGGSFTSFNGVSRLRIARLNENGSLDPAFVGPTINTDVYALALQNGKVIAGGAFLTDGLVQPLRLTSSGAVDSTFDVGMGFEVAPINAYDVFSPVRVSAIAIQSDGKPLLGGIFNQYNGTPRVCLARLTDSKLNFIAASRKAHGAGGPAFDVNLPLTGAPGIECRSGGANGDYQVVFNFAGAVSLGSATVTSGVGTVIGATGSGTSTLTVNLTGITSAQRITLTLSNVSTGMSTTDLAVPIGFLIGDTNGDGFVNAGDATQTRKRAGQTTDATNFRSDVNTDGLVNSGDTTVVRARSGITLP